MGQNRTDEYEPWLSDRHPRNSLVHCEQSDWKVNCQHFEMFCWLTVMYPPLLGFTLGEVWDCVATADILDCNHQTLPRNELLGMVFSSCVMELGDVCESARITARHIHRHIMLSCRGHPCPFIFKFECLTPEVPPAAAFSLSLCLCLCLNGFIRLEAVCSHPTALINISLALSCSLLLFLACARAHTHAQTHKQTHTRAPSVWQGAEQHCRKSSCPPPSPFYLSLILPHFHATYFHCAAGNVWAMKVDYGVLVICDNSKTICETKNVEYRSVAQIYKDIMMMKNRFTLLLVELTSIHNEWKNNTWYISNYSLDQSNMLLSPLGSCPWW